MATEGALRGFVRAACAVVSIAACTSCTHQVQTAQFPIPVPAVNAATAREVKGAADAGDGDLDLLLTTNNGPAYLYRNDQLAGNRSIRFRLVGTKSNRDAIGATVRIVSGGLSQSRMVKSGSSYLSQSELPVTFGLEKRDRVEQVVIAWPSGRTEEYKNLGAGRSYECVEGKGIKAQDRF